MNRHEWLLKRNCSLSPRQLGLAYVVLFSMSFAVAMLCLLHGAWQVIGFAILEMTAVAVAFLHYARHATDHEHIALSEGCLLVEQVLAGKVRQIRFDPYWTRIGMPCSSRDLIRLQSGSVKVEVGRFITEAKRRQVAQELRRELQSSLMTPQDI